MKSFFYPFFILLAASSCHTLLPMDTEKTNLSIANLIERHQLPELEDGTLDLESMQLNSTDGIEQIPFNDEVRSLSLTHNFLRSITSLPFANLTHLYLNHNPICRLQAGMFDATVQLRDLYLASTHLAEIPPHLFEALSNLEEIDLSNNMLTQLDPKIFFHNQKLKNIELHHNKINSLHPKTFSSQSNLQILLLSANNLRTLPRELCAPLTKLKFLLLANNEITNFELGTFDTLGELKQLNCSGNKITSLHPQLLSACTSLTELNLAHNQLATLPTAVIAPLTALRTLNLSANNKELKNNLSYETVQLIQKRSLHIGDQDLIEQHPTQTLEEYVTRLQKENRLQEFYFEDPLAPGFFCINLVNHGLSNIDDLPKYIPDPHRVLTIQACNNLLTQIPCLMLTHFPNLCILDLSNNLIESLIEHKEDSTGSPLTYTLCAKRLTYLGLTNNKIKAIPRHALVNLPNLTDLQLGYNEIREIESGTFHDADNASDHCDHLELCILNNNKLRGFSATTFGSHPTSFPKLELLDLANNELGASEQYNFPSTSAVQFYPQNTQPLQILTLQKLCDIIYNQSPQEKLSTLQQIPKSAKELLATIAPPSLKKYLALDEKISTCLQLFHELASAHQDEELFKEIEVVWIAALEELNRDQWDEGIALFLHYLEPYAAHQKQLHLKCQTMIKLFNQDSLVALAKRLTDISPVLQKLFIDACPVDIQQKIAQAREVYAQHEHLAKSLSNKKTSFLKAFNITCPADSPPDKCELIELQWAYKIKLFKEIFASWTPEMQQAFFELSPDRMKKDLAINGIVNSFLPLSTDDRT